MARRGITDHELGMKMVDTEELYLFLEAYEQVTGEALELRSPAERPDFL